MKSIVSRFLHSKSTFPKLYYTTGASKNLRLLSTDSNKVDEPLTVEEAETINVPPPPSEKLLVLGGNGFVGSHVCKEALEQGLSVCSLSRSGRSNVHESWANDVTWHRGSLLMPESWMDVLDGVTSVISCVGGFGSNSYMYKINGTANINAIRVAAEKGLKRFVYVSAADFGVVNYLLQGYYEGKRAAEAELLAKFPYGELYDWRNLHDPSKGSIGLRAVFSINRNGVCIFKDDGGVILRPGFIYGTRQVGSMKLPLGVIGSPLEMILQHAKPLNRIPLVGPLLTSPASVTSVAKVAVRAATDPAFPPGIVDVYGILRYGQQK